MKNHSSSSDDSRLSFCVSFQWNFTPRNSDCVSCIHAPRVIIHREFCRKHQIYSMRIPNLHKFSILIENVRLRRNCSLHKSADFCSSIILLIISRGEKKFFSFVGYFFSRTRALRQFLLTNTHFKINISRKKSSVEDNHFRERRNNLRDLIASRDRTIFFYARIHRRVQLCNETLSISRRNCISGERRGTRISILRSAWKSSHFPEFSCILGTMRVSV